MLDQIDDKLKKCIASLAYNSDFITVLEHIKQQEISCALRACKKLDHMGSDKDQGRSLGFKELHDAIQSIVNKERSQ